MGSIPGTRFCPGDPISVSFTVTGYFQHRNAFTLQLSNSSGGFDKDFQNLGSLQVSADNGNDIIVGGLPSPSSHASWRSESDSVAVGNYLDFSSDGSDDSIFWDFGTTAKSTSGTGSYVRDIQYLTGGRKTVIIHNVAVGGCVRLDTLSLNIIECTTPSVPNDAVVIAHDSTISSTSHTLWVNPGVTVTVSSPYGLLVFAESGSKVIASNGGIVYLKRGAQWSGKNLLVIHDSATSYTGTGIDLLCTPLAFDYTNAPPNVAFRNGVFKEMNESLIQLSTNPAHNIVNISGLPKAMVSATLVNVLGATVREIANPRASMLKLDLRDLQTGTYFLRIAMANSVIT